MTDVRKGDWFSSLTINGRLASDPIRGNIMHCVSEALKAVQTTRLRADGSGEKEIIIRIKNVPIDAKEDLRENLSTIAGLESIATMHSAVSGPEEGESAESYHARLLSVGLPESTADIMLFDWFDLQSDESDYQELRRWISDPKAIRFRRLCASEEAYESALPNEYDDLEEYCRNTYPRFLANLTLRKAR